MNKTVLSSLKAAKKKRYTLKESMRPLRGTKNAKVANVKDDKGEQVYVKGKNEDLELYASPEDSIPQIEKLHRKRYKLVKKPKPAFIPKDEAEGLVFFVLEDL